MQKVVLAAMLEGKSMPSNMAANTNRDILSSLTPSSTPYYLVEKSKCHKISPLNAFPLKFRVRGCALSIFGIGKAPTHCLKEALVT